MNVYEYMEERNKRMSSKEDKKLQRKADKAMVQREKEDPHTYSPYDSCSPCSLWMKVWRESEFEDGFICHQDPEGIHLKAMAFHVYRAKLNESCVIDGVTASVSGPAGLISVHAEAHVEWVYALMYLLGWKRPNWAKQWEWM